MRAFLLMILFSFLALATDKDIIINQKFLTTDIFQDGVTYNVVSFSYNDSKVDENIDGDEDGLNYNSDAPNEDNLKLGIVSSDNVLVDLIWEYQSLSNEQQNNVIQSVELIDLNNDNQIDIVIHYNDNDSDYPDQVITSFLINQNKKFQEISETFVKNRYTILDNSHIIYKTPLALFGRPYVDEEANKESNFWVDHYEFQGFKLSNINPKYRQFYEDLKLKSQRQLDAVLQKISGYKMSNELTINQLQLEEYFNEVTELKTIIYRCNQILY
ncbi:MAG: hypothetical protein VW397_01000 [Candidatus Margulisiibacteriota bacterium]